MTLPMCSGTAPAPRLVMSREVASTHSYASHSKGLARDQSEAFRLGLLFESFRMDAGRGSISLSLNLRTMQGAPPTDNAGCCAWWSLQSRS